MRPFNSTICRGSASETLRVRLLSRPHVMHAPMIANGPTMSWTLGRPDHVRKTAPATRRNIPSAILRSKFSPKTNQARTAVAAPSSVSSSDEVDASVRAKPIMSNAGPTIPPAAMALLNQGNSVRAS